MHDARVNKKGICRCLGTPAMYRKVTLLNILKPAWSCWNSCNTKYECISWHKNLYILEISGVDLHPTKNSSFILHLTKQQHQYHLRWWRRESRRKFAKTTAGCVEAWKLESFYGCRTTKQSVGSGSVTRNSWDLHNFHCVYFQRTYSMLSSM